MSVGEYGVLQEEDPPAGLRPLFIVKLERGATFDEEGDQDLYSPDEFFDRRIDQFASPYFKVAVSASVAFNKFPGGFEVPR